jgi:glyoxylase-like metal-dependent hydrolase (beta-lactamase superfamily II)
VNATTTRVLAPNPSVFTGPGTNTYLVGGETTLICIDPGPDDDAHLAAILEVASSRGARITTIVLTHSHPDHRPLAARLAASTGAVVRCFDPTAGDDHAQQLHDGDVVRADGISLTAVHTPGHTRDHLCFHDAAARTLYTGDHILSGTTTVIHPGEGDMSEYMDSLRRVRELFPATIFPGHGERVDDAASLIDEYISHRLEREAQVLGAARTQAAPIAPMDLVPNLYAGYPVEVYPLAAWTVEAHLDKLVLEGLIDRIDGGSGSEEPRYLAHPA